MFKQGLVLGRFEPFHLGHQYLIDTALEQCDNVTLLVCTLESESIEGYLRYDWIKRTYNNHDRLKIVHITEDLPQEPKDKHDYIFWHIWTNLIVRECYNIDAIFTSEKYGDNIKKYMADIQGVNIEHICVDKARNIVPVSGTKIRNNPRKYWKYIPKVARPYFVKRICIIGAESVGKSTMVKKLSEYFDCNYVDEYGRTYTEMYGGEIVNTQAISYIAQQQLYNEEQVAYDSDNGLIICDTNLIVTEIFSDIYNGECPLWIKQYNRTQKYDLYLLLNNDVSFIDDGTRQFKHIRDEHYDLLRNELYKRKENYVIIEGSDYIERYKQAKKAISNLIDKYNGD